MPKIHLNHPGSTDSVCELTTTVIKMGKKHFYSGHSNGCSEKKMLHWVIPGKTI